MINFGNINIKNFLLFFFLYLGYVSYSIIKIKIYSLGWGQYYLGHDEISWQNNSLYFVENGIGLSSLIGALSLHSSFNNFGLPYLFGLSAMIAGDSYYLIVFIKGVFFSCSVILIGPLLRHKDFSSREVFYCRIFLIIYYPVIHSSGTFLRDDVILYSIIIALFLALKFKDNPNFVYFILLSTCLYFIIVSRPHSILIFIALSIFYFRIFHIWSISFFIIPLTLTFIFYFYGFDLYSYSVNFILSYTFDIAFLVKGLLKWLFGPNPINLIILNSRHSPYWYTVTTLFIFFCFLLPSFYRVIFRERAAIISLILLGFFPYLIAHQSVDIIGPRQFATTGYFLFVIIYVKILSNFTFGRMQYRS